jgi:hypothetical protein
MQAPDAGQPGTPLGVVAHGSDEVNAQMIEDTRIPGS